MTTTTVKAMRIKQLLSEGKTYSEISQLTGAAPSTISYHAKKITGAKKVVRNKKYDWKNIQSYYDVGNSVSAVMDRFNIPSSVLHGAKKRGDVFLYREKNIAEIEREENKIQFVNKTTDEVLYTIAISTMIIPNNEAKVAVFEGTPETDHSNWVTVFRKANIEEGMSLAKVFVRRLCSQGI